MHGRMSANIQWAILNRSAVYESTIRRREQRDVTGNLTHKKQFRIISNEFEEFAGAI